VCDVRIWRVETQNDHGLPHASVVSWLLLVEEGIVHHVASPVESSEMMEEACNQVGSRDRARVVGEGLGSP
jgi:hypothetical protein